MYTNNYGESPSLHITYMFTEYHMEASWVIVAVRIRHYLGESWDALKDRSPEGFK